MHKKKSNRNKTIDTSPEEGKKYLNRCMEVSTRQKDIGSVIDSTIKGDMFEVCKFLPTNSVDLIIVDPPYNLTKTFNNKQFTKKTQAEYEDYTHTWLKAIKPLLKQDGSIYVCCDWKSSLIIGNVLMEYFTVRNRITWQRDKGRGAKTNWKNGMEDIWFASNSDDYTFDLDAVKVRRKVLAPYRVKGKPKDWDDTAGGKFRDSCPSNFWDDITIPFWSMAENTAHPTQKSEKLMAKIILASSMPGDIVFDPFLGSGTSSVVAKKLGRHYIGIERDPQYCVWAEQRLEMADSDSEIQGYVDGVFWERNTLPYQKKARSTANK